MLRGTVWRVSTTVGMAAILSLSASCRPNVNQPTRSGPTAVVVDTDMGADDIIALLYLLGRPDVRVVAVTVVGDGIAHGRAGADNARALLAAAGRSDVPVGYGS